MQGLGQAQKKVKGQSRAELCGEQGKEILIRAELCPVQVSGQTEKQFEKKKCWKELVMDEDMNMGMAMVMEKGLEISSRRRRRNKPGNKMLDKTDKIEAVDVDDILKLTKEDVKTDIVDFGVKLFNINDDTASARKHLEKKGNIKLQRKLKDLEEEGLVQRRRKMFEGRNHEEEERLEGPRPGRQEAGRM